MLNTDYKIIVKTLTTCLQNIIHSIIYKDQTGFVKDCSIKTNIIQAFLLQNHNKSLYTTYLLFDLVKVFDCIDHT
jgi:Reverse transcriptase (RNA-dependent DNA polymerase)